MLIRRGAQVLEFTTTDAFYFMDDNITPVFGKADIRETGRRRRLLVRSKNGGITLYRGGFGRMRVLVCVLRHQRDVILV